MLQTQFDPFDRISNGLKEVTPCGERFQEEGRGNQGAADSRPSLLIWVRSPNFLLPGYPQHLMGK